MPTFDLPQVLAAEKKLLEEAQVPIITVSASFRKELIEQYHLPSPLHTEALFSRAHYSMAEAVRLAAIKAHRTSHLVDPTNFVDPDSWGKIEFTEDVGQLMARHHLLKTIKDKIDTIARSKLPITAAITPPLLALTKDVTRPIVSLHYEAGNIVAAAGKPIVQVLTDPHVRPQYLDPLTALNPGTDKERSDGSLPESMFKDNSKTHSSFLIPHSSIHYAVFDLATKKELLAAAKSLGKQLSSDRVIVTGPPIDPRVAKLAKTRKRIAAKLPINVGITTGGLGTNLPEIKAVLTDLAPLISPQSLYINLFLYAGVHKDFRDFFESFAADHNLRIGNLNDTTAELRILYEDSIIDANDNLINYLFPWADVIITKPSGDMAYDAAAAGCVPLFLEPWGQWEQNIQNRFIKLGVGFDLSAHKAHKHFTYLLSTNHLSKAQTKAINLPPLYRQGASKIIHLQHQLSRIRHP